MSWSELKAQAEHCFNSADYIGAANGYSAALAALREQDGAALDQAKLLANRCAALQRLGDWERAVSDAEEACDLAPTWEKGKLSLQPLRVPARLCLCECYTLSLLPCRNMLCDALFSVVWLAWIKHPPALSTNTASQHGTVWAPHAWGAAAAALGLLPPLSAAWRSSPATSS